MYLAQKGAMAGNPLSIARRQLSAWQSSDLTNGTGLVTWSVGEGVIVEVYSTVVVWNSVRVLGIGTVYSDVGEAKTAAMMHEQAEDIALVLAAQFAISLGKPMV